jgi:maleylacetate reductase
MRFVHDNLPQRACFGSGAAATHIHREIGRLGASRAMVISSQRDASQAEKITAEVPVVLRYHDVVMHVPV